MNPSIIIPQFLDSIAWAQSTAFEVNVNNGWWDDRNNLIAQFQDKDTPPEFEEFVTRTVMLSALGLVTSEVAEAMEATRKHQREDWADANRKDTLVRELAGTVIRVMDIAERFKLPLGPAIIAELEANKLRGHKHGGKHL